MNTFDDPHGIRTFLMERALEEEQRNWITRAWATLFLVISGGYIFGFGILLIAFSKIVYPLQFVDAQWFMDWCMPVPAAIFGTLGFMGWIISGKNSTMELHAGEIAQIDGSPNVWDNLPQFGRVLLAIFGSALTLGVVTLVLRIFYKILF